VSALSDKFVRDPREVVRAGQLVKVKVIDIDLPRQRIALSMRLTDEPAARGSMQARPANASRNGPVRQGNAAGGDTSSQRPQPNSAVKPDGQTAMQAAFAALKKR
jgi:uncharacterized protein